MKIAAAAATTTGAMSSAFWAAPIVELGSRPLFDAARHALIPAPGAGGDKLPEWYAADGGLVDTSGIVALLRRGVRRLVVFENKNSVRGRRGSQAAPQSPCRPRP